MWLKSSCVACQWRTLHLLARSNTCAPKSFKGSRSRASCRGVLSPSAVPAVRFRVPLRLCGDCDGSMGKQSGEKLYHVKLQGLVAFSEVKVCLTAKSLIWSVNLFFWRGKGFGKFFWKMIFNFFFFFCFIVQGIERSFFVKYHTLFFPWNCVVVTYVLCFHIFLKDLLLWKSCLSSPQFWEQSDVDFWRRCSCCFVVVTQSFLMKRKRKKELASEKLT